MNPLALFGFGLLFGMRHAADADHVVAVTAIAVRTRGVLASTRLGIVWGLGHTLTLFLAGGAIIAFNLVVSPRVGLSFEFAVALALIVVGLMNIRSHPGARSTDRAALEAPPPLGRAFVLGLVHGLSGSAAVALLLLGTVRNAAWACAYLIVFGIGTLLGMAIITTAIASPLRAAGQRWHSLGRRTRLATGALSLVFGAWLAYQTGWHDGLFSALPHWEPH